MPNRKRAAERPITDKEKRFMDCYFDEQSPTYRKAIKSYFAAGYTINTGRDERHKNNLAAVNACTLLNKLLSNEKYRTYIQKIEARNAKKIEINAALADKELLLLLEKCKEKEDLPTWLGAVRLLQQRVGNLIEKIQHTHRLEKLPEIEQAVIDEARKIAQIRVGLLSLPSGDNPETSDKNAFHSICESERNHKLSDYAEPIDAQFEPSDKDS